MRQQRVYASQTHHFDQHEHHQFLVFVVEGCLQMSDSCIALTGKGYVMMAADTTFSSSIVKRLTDLDKIMLLDEEKLLNCVELDPGDRANFLDFVQKNMHLHEYRTGRKLGIASTSSWVRRELADALRSRKPYRVNLLLGGLDETTKEPSLYYLDHLASSNKIEFGAQGYCGYMAPAVLDRYWKPNMSVEEGLVLMKQVIDQLRQRFAFSQNNFLIKILTKDGVQVVKY